MNELDNAKIDAGDRLNELRVQIATLRVVRVAQIDALKSSNELLEIVKAPLQFNTTAPHPSYEIHLIDDLIGKLSAEFAAAQREYKKLYISV